MFISFCTLVFSGPSPPRGHSKQRALRRRQTTGRPSDPGRQPPTGASAGTFARRRAPSGIPRAGTRTAEGRDHAHAAAIALGICRAPQTRAPGPVADPPRGGRQHLQLAQQGQPVPKPLLGQREGAGRAQ
ncbi:uncharacterized protein LOC143512854 [Brachyhypopomus gauderio]|uniref:uncharacterized protein LOC143512854 n=1 Tax=Brachyhypopomus gauderio TaxID=698409 RepID=UPI0040432D68